MPRLQLPSTELTRKETNSTGASRIFIFDHKTRCGPSNWHKLGKGNRSSRGPLLRAHVDQSYDGAELVLRRWFPEEADELVKKRYQIINVRLLSPRMASPLLIVLDMAPHPHDPQRPAWCRGRDLDPRHGPSSGRNYLPRRPGRDVDDPAARDAPVVLQVRAAARRDVADQVLRLRRVRARASVAAQRV